MNKQKTVECGCMTGVGATIAEAKKDLKQKLENAMNGTYEPRFVCYKGYMAIVYRQPIGWGYRLCNVESMTQDGINECGPAMAFDNFQDAIDSAARHVLDLAGRGDFHKDEDIPAFLTNQKYRNDLISLSQFQRAYSYIHSTKPQENDFYWHRWACENQNNPQFI